MLKEIGVLSHADKNGFLPSIGKKPEPVFRETIEILINNLCKTYKRHIYAIAVRGSVSRNTAVVGVSDIDIVVITRSPQNIKSTFINGFRIDISCLTKDELKFSKKELWLKFTLAYSGYVVYQPFGKPLLSEIPKANINKNSFKHLNEVHTYNTYKNYWEKNPNKESCVWVMKGTLRALFEIIMIKINAYSDDIYICAKELVQQFPKYKKQIWEIANLVVYPSNCKNKINDLLSTVNLLLNKVPT